MDMVVLDKDAKKVLIEAKQEAAIEEQVMEEHSTVVCL